MLVKVWRFINRLDKRGFKLPSVIFRGAVMVLLSSRIDPAAEPGPGLVLMHGGLGVGVHANTTFGSDVALMPFATLSTDTPFNSGRFMTIGDRVTICRSAIVYGPVEIGDDAVVGIGAVVTKSVPPGAVVAGVPAKVISMNGREYNARRLADAARRRRRPRSSTDPLID